MENDMPLLSAPRVGVAVWVVWKRQLLLGRRIKTHGKGYWAAPGGHLEAGESLEACAARETQEECGVARAGIRFYAVSNDIFTASGQHYVTIHMQAEAVDGAIENREPHKYADWQWFSWNALPQPIFLPMANVLRACPPPPYGIEGEKE